MKAKFNSLQIQVGTRLQILLAENKIKNIYKLQRGNFVYNESTRQ